MPRKYRKHAQPWEPSTDVPTSHITRIAQDRQRDSKNKQQGNHMDRTLDTEAGLHSWGGGRYWTRTSDLIRVKDAL